MRAIIVGGGIGGLTAAIALRRRGIDADVFERSAELREVGAGISLWPNAVKALRKLGLGAELDAVSLVNPDGELRQWTGRVLSRTSAREHLGQTCVGFDQDVGSVTAHFAEGYTATGDLLIGADGLRSAVRAGLGHADPPCYSGYTAWRAVVPYAADFVPGETWGCGSRFGAIPIQGGRVYWYAATNAPEGGDDSPEGPRASLLRLFRGWHEPIADLIQAAAESAILRNDIYDRDPLSSWSQGRVTLLGDAAHPMTPNLGQGGCQAIEDALVLASSLASEPDPEEALKRYEARRIQRTSEIVRSSRRIGAVGQSGSSALCWLRDLMGRLTPPSVAMGSVAKVAGYEDHLSD